MTPKERPTHSPLPWTVDPNDERVILAANGATVACIDWDVNLTWGWPNKAASIANRNLILRAVNELQYPRQ